MSEVKIDLDQLERGANFQIEFPDKRHPFLHIGPKDALELIRLARLGVELAEARAETERWHDAYSKAHDQALENGVKATQSQKELAAERELRLKAEAHRMVEREAVKQALMDEERDGFLTSYSRALCRDALSQPPPAVVPASELLAKDAEILGYMAALERISLIPNYSHGGDWQEIENARAIAMVALKTPPPAIGDVVRRLVDSIRTGLLEIDYLVNYQKHDEPSAIEGFKRLQSALADTEADRKRMGL